MGIISAQKKVILIGVFLLAASRVLAANAPASLSKGASRSARATPVKTSLKAPMVLKNSVSLSDLLGKAPAGVIPAVQGGGDLKLSAFSATEGFSDEGLGNFSGTLKTDPHSGIPQVVVPFVIPEGRGGITPRINLSWSSTGGGSPVGWGWSLELGSITRSLKEGVPHYNAEDIFIANFNGQNDELVSLESGVEYRARRDQDRVRYFLENGAWRAKDRRGTTYFFGSRPGSSRTKGSGDVFEWRLDRIEDLFGNVLVVDYFPEGGFEARYSLKNGRSPASDVESAENFAYVIRAVTDEVDRPDVRTNYQAGFAFSERRLISSLQISAGGGLIRKYELDYVQSQRTGRSLLKSVREIGRDSKTERLVVNLSYNDEDAPSYTVRSIVDPLQGDNLWSCVIQQIKDLSPYAVPEESGPYVQASGAVFGLNWNTTPGGSLSMEGPAGTGAICSTYLYSQSVKTVPFTNPLYSHYGGWSLVLNGAERVFFPASMTLQKGYNLIEMWISSNRHIGEPVRFALNTDLAPRAEIMNSAQVIFPQLVGDFNGDGMGDAAIFSSATGTLQVALSKGDQFLPKNIWIENFGKGGPIFLGDFNRDGKSDLASRDPVTGRITVALASEGRFIPQGVWLESVPADSDILTGDWNGDGASDLLMIKRDGTGWQVEEVVSSGHGFTRGRTFRPELGGTEALILTADFNGDSLSDLAGFEKSSGTWRVHLNTSGFSSAGQYAFSGFAQGRTPIVADLNQDGAADIGYFDAPSSKIIYRPSCEGGFKDEAFNYFDLTLRDPLTTQAQTADMNGDGVFDLLAFDNMGRLDIALSSGMFPDLVTSYDNGVGGKIALSYQSSVEFENRYLPFAFPVLRAVVLDNSLGDTIKTTFGYSGGYWDPAEREMYGFEEARQYDAEGNYSLSQFDQTSIYLRGHLKRQAVYDRAGRILKEERFLWNNDPVFTGRGDIRFVSLKREDRFLYDMDSALPLHLRTAVDYRYDIPLGVPMEVIDQGEVNWATGEDIGDDLIRTAITYGKNDPDNVLGVETSRISYDKNNQILGKKFFYYDRDASWGRVTKGLLTRTDRWNKEGAREYFVSDKKEYNSFGQAVVWEDALGQRSEAVYDPVWSLFVLQTVNAKGQVREKSYYGINNDPAGKGAWGLAATVTDLNGQTAHIIYDAFGRVSAEIGPLDSEQLPSAVHVYEDKKDHRVHVLRRRIENGKAQTLDSYTYIDGLDRTLAVKAPSGQVGKYVVLAHKGLNSRGLVEREYQPYFSSQGLGVLELPDKGRPATVYLYDALGRLIKVTTPDGNYSLFRYTPRSVSLIDPNGHKTVRTLDARGRVIRIENYKGASGQSGIYPAQSFSVDAVTHYRYSPLGELVKVEDAKGNVTAISYDALGRKIAMDDPDMHHISYIYDALGQLRQETNARGITISQSYDALGRVTEKAPAERSAEKVIYKYDDCFALYSRGRLSGAEYSSGRTNFGYDVLGRETEAVKSVGWNSFPVRRVYDALDRIQRIDYPDGKTSVHYGYDPGGAMRTITLERSDGQTLRKQVIISDVEYTALGRVAKILYGNGASALYAYDPITSRLLRYILRDRFGKTLEYQVYSYDPLGNIVRIEDQAGKVWEYSYDHMDRLVKAKEPGKKAEIYSYDKTGNIIEKDGLRYAYGEQGAGPHAVTSLSDGTRMVYDAAGNMTSYRTSEKTQYFSYDAFNRLIRVEAMDKGSTLRYPVAQYSYDGDGGRTQKTVYTRSSGFWISRTTRFLGDLAEETDGLMRNFIFFGGSRVAVAEGGKVRWLMGDHLGSTSVVLDENSALKEKIRYSPWGEVRGFEKYGSTPEVAWFYFTGKRLDEESGLYYFGARYYHPRLGRFLTPDTIVQDPLLPGTLDRYAYCHNNPLNLIDPTGHKWKWKSFVRGLIGGIVGAVVTIATGGLGAPLAFALGGMAAGAVTGGLSGGWQGAVMGAAIGGAFGGAVGWGMSVIGPAAGYAAMVAGSGYSLAQGHADALAGGITGGIVGTGLGSYLFDGIYATSSSPSSYNRWDVRGVGTTREEALAISELKGSAVFCVRSRGVLSDFVRAGMEKALGPARAARELAGYLAQADGVSIFAHSEGTMLLAQALKVNISGGVQLPNTTFDFNGPAIMRSTAESLVQQIGGNSFGYHLNSGDPIGVLTTANPFQIAAYGISGLVNGARYHAGAAYANLGM